MIDVKSLFMPKIKEQPANHDSAIVYVLKNIPTTKAKLVVGDSWLIWNSEIEMWQVFYKKWNSNKTKLLIATKDEIEAVKNLLTKL